MAILTPALASLRAGFNTAFPNRDKTSDGWIGDPAHQAETSGHNPDDTDGVRAEYSDTDTIAEVRAIDVDKDLNAGVTMYDVIRRILATPADLARLRYIIFCPPSGPLGANVPTIWSRSNGWKPARYYGSNPHDKHCHLSGDQGTDNDAAAWSVAQMGDDMSADEVWAYDIGKASGQGSYTARGAVITAFNRTGTLANVQLPQALAALSRLESTEVVQSAAITALADALAAAGGDVDAAPILAAIEAVKSGLGAQLAEAVAKLAALQADLDTSQAHAAELERRLTAAYTPTES